jgi:[protein-PII] uridylyltransferase
MTEAVPGWKRGLLQEFHRKYWRKVVSKNSDCTDQKLEERRREYQKFGETVYLSS